MDGYGSRICWGCTVVNKYLYLLTTVESDPSYSTLRKLSRVFVQACDHYGVNKSSFPSPSQFQQHLIDNGAESDIINAFRVAVKKFKQKSSELIHIYTNNNFSNWP